MPLSMIPGSSVLKEVGGNCDSEFKRRRAKQQERVREEGTWGPHRRNAGDPSHFISSWQSASGPGAAALGLTSVSSRKLLMGTEGGRCVGAVITSQGRDLSLQGRVKPSEKGKLN